MSKYLEKAKELRKDREMHINCTQAMVMAYAQELGITEEQAKAMGKFMGRGMQHGGTCGALSGALIILGMLGYDEKEAAKAIAHFKETHTHLDCVSLLKVAKDKGIERREHCNAMIYEMLEYLETVE